MKKLFLLFAAVIMAIGLTSCEGGGKYTVWTDSGTYDEFQTAFQTTLKDGYYTRVEITSAQWTEISKGLTSNGKHRWSEAEIKKWLIGNGFGEYESTKESSWLVMVDHGLLATRTSNMVYLILK